MEFMALSGFAGRTTQSPIMDGSSLERKENSTVKKEKFLTDTKVDSLNGNKVEAQIFGGHLKAGSG